MPDRNWLKVKACESDPGRLTIDLDPEARLVVMAALAPFRNAPSTPATLARAEDAVNRVLREFSRRGDA